MVLDKKQIWVIFFKSSSKWVIKQQRQLATSTIHLAHELLMNMQCSSGSRSFAKEMGALKIRSTVTSHWELTTTTWELSLKLILLQIHEKLPKNSTLIILWLFSIWNKLDRWKSLISRCLMSWLQIKKKVFKYRLLLSYAIITNHFSIRSWDVEKSGFYTTTSDDQLSDWTKKKLQITFQSQTCTEKRSRPLVVCCLSDPLQLSESCQNHYIWKVWSTDRWDASKTAMSAAVIDQEWDQFFCMTILDLRLHNQHFKG